VVRHAGLIDAVGDLMTEAGYRVWREVTGNYGPFPLYMSQAARRGVARGEQRRLDLVGVTTDLEAVCVDPTLLDAAATRCWHVRSRTLRSTPRKPRRTPIMRTRQRPSASSPSGRARRPSWELLQARS
jgi:hypothetical protein